MEVDCLVGDRRIPHIPPVWVNLPRSNRNRLTMHSLLSSALSHILTLYISHYLSVSTLELLLQDSSHYWHCCCTQGCQWFSWNSTLLSETWVPMSWCDQSSYFLEWVYPPLTSPLISSTIVWMILKAIWLGFGANWKYPLSAHPRFRNPVRTCEARSHHIRSAQIKSC